MYNWVLFIVFCFSFLPLVAQERESSLPGISLEKVLERTDTIIVRIIYPDFLENEKKVDSLIELGVLERVVIADSNSKDSTKRDLPNSLYANDGKLVQDSIYLASLQNSAKYDSANPLRRIQLVSKKSFEFFPVDVLNRFNSHAPFFFDGNDRRVKSIVFKNEEEIPQVYFLRKDIDTTYFYLNDVLTEQSMKMRKNIVFEVNRKKMEGDLGDYLIRLSFRKEFRQMEESIEVTVCEVDTDAIQSIIDQLREFRIKAELSSPLNLLYFNQSGN